MMPIAIMGTSVAVPTDSTYSPPAMLASLPGGSRQSTRATLRIMRNTVREAKTHYPLIQLARQITLAAGVPQKDWTGEARAIQQWVRDRIRYVRDPAGLELVQTPEETLRIKSGDCDDKSVLAGTLLQAIGHPVRFRAVGISAPKQYQHVFPETRIGTKWVSIETTEPVDIGWLPAGIRRDADMLEYI